MPNFKIFQDNPNDALIKIYGTDISGVTQAILTTDTGAMSIAGTVGVSGNVGVSGTVGVSGSVAVSGPVEISGTVGVSGNVGVSGTVGVSGSVAVSGPVEISGTVGVSGDVGVSGTVAISGHTIVDSGPITSIINSGQTGESGAVSEGSYDIMSYSSWTLAVKYSGASGDQVTVELQTSALSGTAATDADYVTDSTKTFASGSWNFYTAGITPRYARLYYIDTATSSGALLSYFQAQN